MYKKRWVGGWVNGVYLFNGLVLGWRLGSLMEDIL